MRRWRCVAAALLVSASSALAGCGGGRPANQAAGPSELSALPLSGGERLRVVATTNIVADVVVNIGGDRIELTGLLPAGADPHTYEPTPRDLRAVADAHVILVNGVELESFLDEMIRSAGGDAPVVAVSSGVALLQLDSGDGEHGQAEADPHTWFDPNNVLIWVGNVESTLATLDPANAGVYRANARAYVSRLEALDVWIREQVAQLAPEKRKLVTDHRMLGYFADEYGFEAVGAIVEAFSAAAQPSAQELVALERSIQELGVPAVFVGRTANPKLAARVAEDTGVQLVPLYTESLSAAGGEAGTYLDFMRYNVSAIVAALR